MVFHAWRVDQKLDHASLCIHLSYHVFFCLASDETFFDARGIAGLNFSWGAERRCGSVSYPHRRAVAVGGGNVEEFCSDTSHHPTPALNA